MSVCVCECVSMSVCVCEHECMCVCERVASYFTTGKKAKVHPCTGTEALYRPYGP